MFAEKWQRVTRIVFDFSRRFALCASDRDDLLQCAGIMLWTQCVRIVRQGNNRQINCLLIAMAGYRDWARSKRHADKYVDDIPFDLLPGPEQRAIVIDDIPVTLRDAALDDPTGVDRLIDLMRTGVGVAELAKRWGVSYPVITQAAARLGAVKLDGRTWTFPHDAERPRPQRKRKRPAKVEVPLN